ncbi:unnamed protein product [Parnassius apollo]|uniref:(apollo) hypothetical protein n=1 Tax=Parnassius apollo TaxID=110799 RepID=A0A8S3X603_PARAO|nr:unnamed protein product [Parnassius apollo]
MVNREVDTGRVIDEVRLRKKLWDASDPLYKNKDARNKAWEDIVDTLFENISGEEKQQLGQKLEFATDHIAQIALTPMTQGLHSARMHQHTIIRLQLTQGTKPMMRIQVNGSTCSEQHNPRSSEQDISMASTSEGESISVPRGEQRQSTSSKNVSQRKGIFRAIGEPKKLQEAVNRDVPEKEDRFDVFARNVAVQLRELSFERKNIAKKVKLLETDVNHLKYVLLSTSRIASAPFDDIICEIQERNELNTQILFLKKGAILSVFPWNTQPISENTKAREERLVNRNLKKRQLFDMPSSTQHCEDDILPPEGDIHISWESGQARLRSMLEAGMSDSEDDVAVESDASIDDDYVQESDHDSMSEQNASSRILSSFKKV